MIRTKRISIWIIALVGLMTVTSAAKADDYDFKSKGVYYKKNGTSGIISLAKVVPEKANYPYYTADANKPTGDISIPRTVTERVILGLEIPYIVTEIGDYAFYGCKGLKSVTIPSSVHTIGNEAFRECSWMTSVHVSGNGLRVIGDAAFAGCDHLESVDIPHGVTKIGRAAFDLCGNLQVLDIPASVTSMGDNLIEECDKLKTIKVYWKTPIDVPANAFSGSQDRIALKVPKGTEAAYRAHAIWGKFKVIEPTSNEAVEASRIYAADGALRLTLLSPATVYIYGISGAMVKTLALPAGDHVLPLPSGVYVVRVGEHVTKVMVK